jgi:hypothetical protein
MSEARALVRQLLSSMTETIDRLQELSDDDLDEACSHGCAMDGGVRRLLVHNIEHDRMHAAAVSNARYDARRMQESELAYLLRDWLRERTELVAQLLVADDSVLELKKNDDEWNVRQQVEHILYWEQDSIDTAMAEAGERAGVASST